MYKTNNSISATHSLSQVWLTCLEPQYLVKKYGEYAHGDPRMERRIVLEQSLIDKFGLFGNIRVVPKEHLLERFVKTVEEQAQIAKRQRNGSLMILIFGHGDHDSKGVHIGGNIPFSRSSLLSIDRVKQAIPRGVNVTLLLTSCFSGAWLVFPNVHYRKSLNVTGIAASGPNEQTRSWSLSESVERACGSSIASGILNQLIKIESNEDSDDDPRSHPTYISLATSIYDMATSMDTFFADQNVHFSAQDDDWESHWRKRTGIPLVRFRSRWEDLRKISSGNVRMVGEAGRSISTRRVGSLEIDINRFAESYFEAKPGRDNLGTNVSVHGAIARYRRGDLEQAGTLQSLLEVIIYRLNMMKDADEYIAAMGFSVPSCHGFDMAASDYQSNPQKRASWNAALNHLRRVQLFPPFMESGEWPMFAKPREYVALVLAEQCETDAHMRLSVAKAQVCMQTLLPLFLKYLIMKLTWNLLGREINAREVLPRARAYKIINDSGIREKLNQCALAFRQFGHKILVKE